MSVPTAVKNSLPRPALMALLALVVSGWLLASPTRVAEAQVTHTHVTGATATPGRDSAVVMVNVAGHPATGINVSASYGPESQPPDQDTSLGTQLMTPPGGSFTITGLTPDTTYRFRATSSRGNATITFTTWPLSHGVRLVSVISYTLDIEELNRLEIERARGEFPLHRAAVFSCVSSDGMSVMVSDSAVSDDTTGLHAWKLPKENEPPLQALSLGIRSDKIRDMSCQARMWFRDTTSGDHDLETNAVKLRWQRKGRTIFRKEEAFRGTPGGTATWLFIPPVFLGLVVAGATKNAAGTLLVVALSLGIAVWFTESPPVLWVVVVGTAAAGVLLFIQFGFRGR